MTPTIVLEQQGPAGVMRLALDAHTVVDKAAPPGARLVLPLRDVRAVLRDRERTHIVGPAGAISFVNEPGRAEFEAFVDQLLQRLQRA